MENSLEFVHRCQLEMAINVKHICEKHNIKYFLDAGTLLGAVRERGFIPWDDDIDIGFEREDYNRFIEIAKKELPDFLYLQEWDNESAYGYPYAKIRYLGTEYRLKTDYHSVATDGIFLDLLPFDSVPNNKIFLSIHSIRLRFLYLMIQFKLGYRPETKFKQASILLKFLSHISNVNRNKKRYEKIVTCYNQRKNSINVTEADGIDYYRFIIPQRIIQNVTTLSFEGVEFCVPKDYDRYLTLVYGNYMKRPDESEQIGKHGVILYS